MAKARNIFGIDCDAPGATAIRLVLTARLEEMCALRESALDWGDPEGVHDMRVASRRLRSAVQDFMPYLRKRLLAASLKEIKAVADALGRVRDHDVAIIALEKLAAKAPEEIAPGIQRLAEIRAAKRDIAREELIQTLDLDLLAQLPPRFVSALDTALTPSLLGKKSKQDAGLADKLSYRWLARTTILKLVEELEELSDSLYHPLRFKPLHKLRIAAKRLRYALELFEQCWGRRAAIFARKVAALQSSLGELHDCDVWIVDFGDHLAKAKKRPAFKESVAEDAEQEAVLVWLLSHFVKVRTKHFRKALVSWREWEANDFSAQLRKTLVAELPERSAPSKAKAPVKVAEVALASASKA
jgi:CHAD domain-containing protein